MRIPDQFLDCVIYLYPSISDAEAGTASGGSGFLVGVPAKKIPGASFVFAVTNQHVIDGGSTVIRLNMKDGRKKIIESDDRKWVSHPNGDDLAVIAITPNQNEDRVAYVSTDQFITKDVIKQYDFGPGDEIFVIGRFINHEGKQRNTPSLRFGHIAQMPNEPIRRDDGFMQESFLVEAKSIGGYSGSPVFTYIPPLSMRPGKEVLEMKMYGPWLLGVDWAHLNDWKPVCDANGRPMATRLKVGSNTGMMAVVPAWKLQEIFDGMTETFEVIEAKALLRSGPSPATSDAAQAPSSNKHRERFNRLLDAAVTSKPSQT